MQQEPDLFLPGEQRGIHQCVDNKWCVPELLLQNLLGRRTNRAIVLGTGR